MGITRQDIDLSSLTINIENPRFEMVGSQRDAILLMIENQQDKLAKLAYNILENNLDPTNPVIVTPHENIENSFNVLEGNRRITALMLLRNPDIIPEKHKALLNKFRKYEEKYQENKIANIPCIVFTDENEAYKWIKLKHTGENDGVGTVTWDAQQKARFEERFEGKSLYALQVLEFITKNNIGNDSLIERMNDVPSSSLQRLLTDPDVRKLIGIEIENGKIVTYLKPEQLNKPLIKIVNDLLREDFKVKEIYYKSDRLNYIETFKASELPDISEGFQHKWELVSVNILEEDEKEKKQSKKKSKHLSTKRNTIIPKRCILHITPPRINAIYRELKDLNLKYLVNAGAVLFRIFVELSLDTFITEKSLGDVSRASKLNKKLTKVKDYLLENNLIEKHKIKPINLAISNPNSVLSIDTFHAYVHNENLNPIADDLKITWDNIEPFIITLWDTI